jgi:hypothetical protein
MKSIDSYNAVVFIIVNQTFIFYEIDQSVYRSDFYNPESKIYIL